MDPSADIVRRPPRRSPDLRDAIAPLLGVLGAAAFLGAIVVIILLINAIPVVHK